MKQSKTITIVRCLYNLPICFSYDRVCFNAMVLPSYYSMLPRTQISKELDFIFAYLFSWLCCKPKLYNYYVKYHLTRIDILYSVCVCVCMHCMYAWSFRHREKQSNITRNYRFLLQIGWERLLENNTMYDSNCNKKYSTLLNAMKRRKRNRIEIR